MPGSITIPLLGIVLLSGCVSTRTIELGSAEEGAQMRSANRHSGGGEVHLSSVDQSGDRWSRFPITGFHLSADTTSITVGKGEALRVPTANIILIDLARKPRGAVWGAVAGGTVGVATGLAVAWFAKYLANLAGEGMNRSDYWLVVGTTGLSVSAAGAAAGWMLGAPLHIRIRAGSRNTAWRWARTSLSPGGPFG